MDAKNLTHWRLELDNKQYLWATLDKKDDKVNCMSTEVLAELSAVIALAKEKRGLVIQSGKKNGFIAGADISEFTQWQGIEDAMQFIENGQTVYDELAALKIPTIALIDGFCLGGGMELALACRYRIAEEGDKTRLGLPEVKLGIFPGWGGTIRMPQLIGGMQAMDLILSGRMVRAKAAKRMGIVDEAVPRRHLQTAVQYYLEQQPMPHQPSFWQSLTNSALFRKVIAWQARKSLASKRVQQAHYPAFFAALNHFEKNGPNSSDGMAEERAAIRPVLEHDTAQNLIRVYGLQEKLKAFAKVSKANAKHVHVIGAGVMGAEIATVCALKGLTVTLQDREAKFIALGIKQAHAIFKKKLKDKRAIQAAMDRLIPDVDGLGVKQADVIIEAIYENLEAKHELFKTLEANAKPEALLATNTSTFPLAEIATVLKDKSRLLGIHFFNPVSKMMLVEVVFDEATDKTLVEKAQAFVGQIDKLPLPVKSSPGFLVNRILMPYLMECVNLVDEGVQAEIIDKAALQFGMPMGPVELADKVGLDICLSAAESLSKHFEVKIPQTLRDKVKQGELGLKSGSGFYQYKNGKIVKNSRTVDNHSSEDIADRLILRLVNEAVACLREGVVTDPDLVDAGMIFGTGFAPFRGGPMHYLNSRGVKEMQAQLSSFEKRYGERFIPDIGWDNLAHAD